MPKDLKPHIPRPPFKCVEGIGSKAMRKLTGSDILVLTMLYEKFNGMNRDNISLPFHEIKERISKMTFFKSIQRLVAFGFIRIVRSGRIGKGQRCSIYGLSDLWRKFERKPVELERIEGALKKIDSLKNSKTQEHRNARRVLMKEIGIRV
ncbi:hypothetical protein ES703_24182 [subsurface metagenome]